MKIIERFEKVTASGKIKRFEKIIAFDKLFIVELDKNGNAAIKKDIEIVENILSKDVITISDRYTLIRIYNVAYHESGKIEDIYSLDSSATNCDFCKAMRALAAKMPGKIICESCYDIAQEKYRFAALNRHTLNMIIFSSVEFEIAELAALPCGLDIRINSSGDAPNKIYANNALKMGFAFPSSNVAIWTKNAPVYINACRKYGKPENVSLIKSSIYIDKPEKLPEFFDYVFTVYFDKEKVKQAIAAGACECNGKKCIDCGKKCYRKTWKSGANIAELLRK